MSIYAGEIKAKGINKFFVFAGVALMLAAAGLFLLGVSQLAESLVPQGVYAPTVSAENG